MLGSCTFGQKVFKIIVWQQEARGRPWKALVLSCTFSGVNTTGITYKSFGVAYGDLSTSPLYVYKSTFSGRLCWYQDEQTILGVLSMIFWTFTLVPFLKYVIIVLSADDNGEGGPFAVFALVQGCKA